MDEGRIKKVDILPFSLSHTYRCDQVSSELLFSCNLTTIFFFIGDQTVKGDRGYAEGII